MNEWFSSYLLSLKFGKTHFMQFITKHSSHNVRNINYDNKIILNTSTLEISGIIINKIISNGPQINAD
jgi:hypothetical protein